MTLNLLVIFNLLKFFTHNFVIVYKISKLKISRWEEGITKAANLKNSVYFAKLKKYKFLHSKSKKTSSSSSLVE